MRFLFFFIWVDKVESVRLFGLPYKAEKEMPFNFHDGNCDRTTRLTYVGGQEVVSHYFIFPPCMHTHHLGVNYRHTHMGLETRV